MHEALDHLANELFRTFARFEYALKAAGFCHTAPHDDAAKPDWTAFAGTVGDALNNPTNGDLREAIEYILSHPPQKQILQDGTLDWREALPTTPPEDRADLLLVLVRRVRNNLFHGGKFSAQWFDAIRSEKLLRHSLTILRECLAASPAVHGAYHHGEWHT